MAEIRLPQGPECERCGRCLSVCPVYRDSRVETLSPRGRLDLIRAVASGGLTAGGRYREAIHSCLQCLACHDACPKGVDGPAMIRNEKAVMVARETDAASRLETLGLRLALGRRSVLAAMAAMARPLAMRESRPAPRHLPLFLPEILAGRRVPDLYPFNRADRLPEVIEPPQSIPVQEEIILFTGCFFGFLDTRPLAAAIQVLGQTGIRIRLPRTQVCCGAPASLSGHPDIMTENRIRNLMALKGTAPVLTLCATCGNALKSEYPKALSGSSREAFQAAALADRVRDLTDYLSQLKGFAPGTLPVRETVTVHPPCHLNRGMKAGNAVAAFLDRIPGLDRVSLGRETDCCGGGGICALKNRELSCRLGNEKAARILETRAQIVAAPCPGCLIQIRDRLSATRADRRVRAVHPMELMAMTYGCPL